MATLKNDLSLHNLSFEDAIEMALDKPLWGLLAASGATHWWCMPNNDDDDVGNTNIYWQNYSRNYASKNRVMYFACILQVATFRYRYLTTGGTVQIDNITSTTWVIITMVRTVCLHPVDSWWWPWPLTFWPQNLIGSSLSQRYHRNSMRVDDIKNNTVPCSAGTTGPGDGGIRIHALAVQARIQNNLKTFD